MYYRKAKHDPSPVMKKARMELHSRTQHRTLANPLTKPAARPQLKGVLRERKPILRDLRERKSVFRDGKIVVRERRPMLNLERVVPSSIYRYVRSGLKPAQKTAKTLLKSSETGTQQGKETEEKATRDKAVKEDTSAGSKKEMEPPSVDSNQDGHYELNPLMTRMLETELQDIMIKVWQDLPDEPLTEAEKLVSNKLKNEAGDDLRNVLGMNITKRLLNVYNPLFVKADFSKKPDIKSIKDFLHQFNCEKLMTNNVIKMKNIADFDVICNTKGLRCGNAKVYIVPYYKFTECPSKLKTIYNVVKAKRRKENEAENKKTAEATEKDNVASETIDNKEVEKNSQNTASVVNNDDIEPTGEKKPVQEKQTGKPEDSKSDVPTESKTAVPRESNTILATATETVVKTDITTGTKTETMKTVALTKPDVSAATKTVITAATKAVAATANKVVATSPNKTVATTANKPVGTSANKVVAATPNKVVATPANKTVATTANKPVGTSANKVVAATPNKVVATPANKTVATTANKPVGTSANKVVAATPNKVVATTANKTVATTANKPVATSANKVVATTPNKVVATTANKPVTTTANKVVATTPNKTVATMANKVVTTTANKPVPTSANKADATTANKAVVTTANKTVDSAVTETVHKATNASKTHPQAQNEVNKTNKPTEGNTPKTGKKVSDTKTVNKKWVEGKITKNDKINQILGSDNKNDDDELEDEDILALISEGIVLDECSGSDGE